MEILDCPKHLVDKELVMLLCESLFRLDHPGIDFNNLLNASHAEGEKVKLEQAVDHSSLRDRCVHHL